MGDEVFMQINLGNFTYWRIKKILVLIVCMLFSMSLIFTLNIEQFNTIFLVAGLILYACFTELPFVKNNVYQAKIMDENDMITINTSQKTYSINKKDIQQIQLKEIRYGGRWLKTIGYRLIVKDNCKHVFDSVLVEDGDLESKKQQMLELKKMFDKAKS